RCLIPVDSFYEWKEIHGKKQPIRFMLKDRSIFSLAGLYDSWECPETGQKLHTCTIITTSPNSLIESVHDRMPVILNEEDEQSWLAREQTDVKSLLELLVPYPAAKMTSYPVSSVVGNVKNDSPACIE